MSWMISRLVAPRWLTDPKELKLTQTSHILNKPWEYLVRTWTLALASQRLRTNKATTEGTLWTLGVAWFNNNNPKNQRRQAFMRRCLRTWALDPLPNDSAPWAQLVISRDRRRCQCPRANLATNQAKAIAHRLNWPIPSWWRIQAKRWQRTRTEPLSYQKLPRKKTSRWI